MEQRCIFNLNLTNLHSSTESEEDMTVASSRRQRTSPSLDYLFSNKEVLARRLKNRPDRVSLVERHIIPAQLTNPGIYDKVTQLERRKTSDFLQKKIRVRPSRNQLVQRHILTDTRADGALLETLTKLERQRIADHLSEHLLQRPGPIELIQGKILSVDSPIQNVLNEVSFDYANKGTDSATISELESRITTLKCTPSPGSPLPSPLFPKHFFETVHATQLNTNLHKTDKEFSENDLLLKSMCNELPNQIQLNEYSKNTKLTATQISLSQKENEKLVKAIVNKKFRPQKPRVKKLKFHECRPAEMRSLKDDHIDERYQSLLEQQTLYLRLQVMQQNAMLNALQGNADPMANMTEEIENVVEKDRSLNNEPSVILSLEGKNLEEMRVIELRAQLKQRGLLVSGSKARLIERLLAYEGGRSNSSDFNRIKDPQLITTSTNSSPLSIPTSSVLQVTTYSTGGGNTYQLIQAVPASNQSIPEYQVMHASYAPTQQVQHVLQPLTSYAKLDDKTEMKTIFPKSAEPPLQLSLSGPSTIIYQQPHYVSEGKIAIPHYYQSNGVTYMTQQHLSTHLSASATDLGQLSQSVPSTIKYSNDYIINPAVVNVLGNFKEIVSNVKNDQFRERASSEPYKPNSYFSSLNEVKESIKQEKNSSSNLVPDLSTQKNKLQSAIQSSVVKSNNEMDDIIDIIGELSKPTSPSNLTSMPTEILSIKNDKSYQSCLLSKQKSLRKNFLPTQQSNKQTFFSISDIPNILCPDNFVTNPYESLGSSHGENLKNHQLSSLNGTLNDIDQASLSNGFNHTGAFSNQHNSLGNVNHPLQVKAEFDSSSPISSSDDLAMDLDNFQNTNSINSINSVNNDQDLSWVEMDTESTHAIHFQSIPPKEILINNPYLDLCYQSHSSEIDNLIMRHDHGLHSRNEYVFDSNGGDVIYSNNGLDQNDQFVSLFELESGEY